MRYLIYIVAIPAILAGCDSAESNIQELDSSEPEINKIVDQRPGMKGVLIGSTLSETADRIKRVNPISGLKLDETTELSPEHAVSFSLADSLQKVGDYDLGRITGRAYNDTIYTLKTSITGEINVKGIRKVLEEVYGEPETIFDQSGVFDLQWNGSEVCIYYSSTASEDDLFSILMIRDRSMARKLFEEPDPFDHYATDDF